MEAQGVDAQKVGIPSLDDIEKCIAADVGLCISFLNAIRSDTELRKQMAIFMQGRLSNSVHKPDLSQLKVPL